MNASGREGADRALGASLQRARERRGLSESEAARSTRIRRRRVATLERGDTTPSEAELAALSWVYQVPVDELTPPGYGFAVVGARERAAVRGDDARDELLREYVAIVLQLRGVEKIRPVSLRHDDLRELAAALGGTTDAIEARLVELLDTDPAAAHTTRVALFASDEDVVLSA